MKYIKKSPIITFKVYDNDTEELLITTTDRNWMNLGEIFTQHHITKLVVDSLNKRKKAIPSNILVMVAEEFSLEE